MPKLKLDPIHRPTEAIRCSAAVSYFPKQVVATAPIPHIAAFMSSIFSRKLRPRARKQ